MIVDDSDESRTVLRALVERQGAVALEVESADSAADLAHRLRPAVIVFDVESDRTAEREAAQRLALVAQDHDMPVIVLGTIPRQSLGFPTGQFVAKPYHYGPLVRRIRGLLAG
jgi:DNA-binding response OmpR family regulator